MYGLHCDCREHTVFCITLSGCTPLLLHSDGAARQLHGLPLFPCLAADLGSANEQLKIAAFAVCCPSKQMLLLCSRLTGMLQEPAHHLTCCSFTAAALEAACVAKSHSLVLSYGSALLQQHPCSAADLEARYQIGNGHPRMLEKATQRLASMFDMKQVDTAMEEQVYVFSAVENVPMAVGRVGAVPNISAQVRTMNCMGVSACRAPHARCQYVRPRSRTAASRMHPR